MNTLSDPDDGLEPPKEAWQVVGCTQCKAPPGMRCTGQRMMIHAVRRRAFIERLAHEADLRQPGVSAVKEVQPWRDAKPPRSGRPPRTERAERPERTPRAGRSGQSARGEHGRGHRNAGRTEIALGTQDDRFSAPLAKAQEDTPPWEELAARLRVEQHIPALPSPVNTPNPEPSFVPSEPVVASSPLGEPLPPLFKFDRKIENPQVWHLVPCPQCRMPAGTRCLGPLSQARFASHNARLEAHRQFEASHHTHEPHIPHIESADDT